MWDGQGWLAESGKALEIYNGDFCLPSYFSFPLNLGLSHKRNLWIWGAVLKDFVWKETDGGMRAYSEGGYLEGIWKISLVCLAKNQLK